MSTQTAIYKIGCGERKAPKPIDLANMAIAMLSDEQRIAIRSVLEASGYNILPRSLYFNYQTQEWIEPKQEDSKNG